MRPRGWHVAVMSSGQLRSDLSQKGGWGTRVEKKKRPAFSGWETMVGTHFGGLVQWSIWGSGRLTPVSSLAQRKSCGKSALMCVRKCGALKMIFHKCSINLLRCQTNWLFIIYSAHFYLQINFHCATVIEPIFVALTNSNIMMLAELVNTRRMLTTRVFAPIQRTRLNLTRICYVYIIWDFQMTEFFNI